MTGHVTASGLENPRQDPDADILMALARGSQADDQIFGLAYDGG